MSDDLEARVHHAITHNGETYIKLADASVTFSIYRKNIAAQAARIAELEAALRFYADPSKYTDIHGDDVQVPDFYSETDFGETARATLAGGKR